MTTLVTGATGFVGAAVVRHLLEKGGTVRVFTREGSDRRNIEGLKVEIATGDLRDRAAVARAVQGCTALYHVAADYRLWVPDPEEIYRTNVEGSRDLLLAAADAGVERMVYTSSVAVLGLNRDGTPSDEETPVALEHMIGHYKRSKFLAEEAVRELIVEEDLPIVIVNPSTPIGPRDVKPTPTGRMIVEAAAGRMPAFVDTGLNIVHVDDVARGHLLAFEKGIPGERYVLGGSDMTLAEILAEIAALVGRKAPKVKLPHDLIMPLAYGAEAWARLRGKGEPFATVDGIRMAKKLMYFSSRKAERELGYESRPPVEALRDAVDWFRAGGYLD
ncbi:MAG: NAD-dependent epimerase/dehydratase family protein [Kiloniellales bacterium]|nr:NAD-dependent epimerase/dehydratase family protein [Kiloniellales bacterium]